MRVLIVGATGPCGILLIKESLSRGHHVVVYARSPSKLPEEIVAHDRVTVITGQLGDLETLTSALQGVDAVLSALGPRVTNGPFHGSDTPIAKGYHALLQAMEAAHCNRLIALGTASIKAKEDHFSATFAALVTGVKTLAYNAYKDIVALGKEITESKTDWTIARVPVLTDFQSAEYIAGYVGDGHTKPALTRKAFSVFVLDELDKGAWVKKLPLVSSVQLTS